MGTLGLLLLVLARPLQAVYQPDQGSSQQDTLLPQEPPRGLPGLKDPAQKARYAKGQLIVKYKDAVTECVHHLVKDRKPFKHATTDGSDSLDKLHAKHQVKAAKALFRTELEEAKLKGPKLLAALRQHHQAKVERVKAKFPSRTRRAPPGAVISDLSHIYVLEVPEETDVEAAVVEFAQDPHVAYAQPNYLATIQGAEAPLP